MVYSKKFSLAALFLYLALLAGNFTACKDEQEYEYFLIQVDSISIPETVPLNEPFVIEFYGTLGNNGC